MSHTHYPLTPRNDNDKYTHKDKYKDTRNSRVPVLMYVGCRPDQTPKNYATLSILIIALLPVTVIVSIIS